MRSWKARGDKRVVTQVADSVAASLSAHQLLSYEGAQSMKLRRLFNYLYQIRESRKKK